MLNLPALIRGKRTNLGITQLSLAHRTRVSLATIQNIESGKANPSLETIESLLRALGIELNPADIPTDWGVLALCGAPLLSNKSDGRPLNLKVAPNVELLIHLLSSAACELQKGATLPGFERKLESLQALLIAIREHFPSFYENHCKPVPAIAKTYPSSLTGKLIRLKRQALAIIATYL